MRPRRTPIITSTIESPPSPTMSEIEDSLSNNSYLSHSSLSKIKNEISLSEVAFAMECSDVELNINNSQIKGGHFIPKNLGQGRAR